MIIKKASHCGFCFGVQNAIDLAEKETGPVYTFGALIHNHSVVHRLIEKGVYPVDTLDEIPSGSKVIIRSHGVGPDVFYALKQKDVKIIDATCIFVKKIHQIVKEHFQNGYTVIIAGERLHPEIIGINGWCENTALIIKSAEEADRLRLDSATKYCMVAQTTFSVETYDKIADCIRNKVKIVEIFNTICYTTKERQSEADTLSKMSDTMLVIGDQNSSNTNKLFQVCKKNCQDSHIIESVEDLNQIKLKKIKVLGITAGASTPPALIEEVVNVMSESQNKSNETLNEENICETQVENEATPEVLTEESVKTVEETVKEQAAPTAEAEAEAAKAETTEEVVKASEPVAKAPKAKTSQTSFEDLLAENESKSVQIRPNKKVAVTVIKADENGIFVSIGSKKDGFIDKSEAEMDGVDYTPENYKTGDELSAIVLESKGKDYVALSKKAVDLRIKEQAECEEIVKGSEFSATVEKAVKGGLLSKFGPFTVFIPASQVKIGYVSDLEKYVGKKLRLRMLPQVMKDAEGNDIEQPDNKISGKRIIASQRIILEEEKLAKEDQYWDQMQVGSVVQGKVKRFTDFGAFVNVLGHDCLAHISDLAWYKIENPAEILEINNTYDFVIIKADRENNKVSLGYKQLQKRPYELAMEKYPVDSVVKGKVERIFNYGAFVSIDRGVDGLVPISEISYEWIKDASQAFKVGDEIEAKIINFEGNKITLSIKALLPEPMYDAEAERADNFDDEDLELKPKAVNKKMFERKPNQTQTKRSKIKKDNEDDIRQWTSDSGTTTLGDLLKDFEFDYKEE